MSHTNKIDNAIGNAKRTGSLNTTANILNLRLKLLTGLSTFQTTEESLGQRSEAGHDIATNKLLGLGDRALLGDLHLQLAAAETEIEDLFHAGDLTLGQGGVVLGDLVAAGDTDVNAAFANEGGDVGGWEEDECNGQVLD